jgi:hypothetical protein
MGSSRSIALRISAGALSLVDGIQPACTNACCQFVIGGGTGAFFFWGGQFGNWRRVMVFLAAVGESKSSRKMGIAA